MEREKEGLGQNVSLKNGLEKEKKRGVAPRSFHTTGGERARSGYM